MAYLSHFFAFIHRAALTISSFYAIIGPATTVASAGKAPLTGTPKPTRRGTATRAGRSTANPNPLRWRRSVQSPQVRRKAWKKPAALARPIASAPKRDGTRCRSCKTRPQGPLRRPLSHFLSRPWRIFSFQVD